MQDHKYKVGDVVQVRPNELFSAPSGTYEITRLLPADNVGNQYRVRNASDGYERVVRESQLEKQVDPFGGS